jgi:hypothetical protein
MLTRVPDNKVKRLAIELSWGSWSPSETRASRSTVLREPPPITLPRFDPVPAARRFLRAMDKAERNTATVVEREPA